MGEHAVTETTLTDEYGKRTRFTGECLIQDTTDAGDNRPQWAEMTVWRTGAGAYVLWRKTCYRIVHWSQSCSLLGPNLVPRPATPEDTYPCRRCNPSRNFDGGYGVQERSSVDVARTPTDLIRMLANQDGTYSGFARATLAAISKKDQAVADLWLEEVVP
jgi:hypothetical protein